MSADTDSLGAKISAIICSVFIGLLILLDILGAAREVGGL
jgi:hypothetical protein